MRCGFPIHQKPVYELLQVQLIYQYYLHNNILWSGNPKDFFDPRDHWKNMIISLKNIAFANHFFLHVGVRDACPTNRGFKLAFLFIFPFANIDSVNIYRHSFIFDGFIVSHSVILRNFFRINIFSVNY